MDKTLIPIHTLKLYRIDSSYMEQLQKNDSNIMKATDDKKNRPHVGIAIDIDNRQYLIPLSSPKKNNNQKSQSFEKDLDKRKMAIILKHQGDDLGKIYIGKMFPVPSGCLKEINIQALMNSFNKSERDWGNLLEDQRILLNKIEPQIYKKANKFYKMAIKNRVPKYHKDFCTNIPQAIQYHDQCIAKNKANVQAIPNAVQKTVNTKQAPATKAPFKLSTKSNQTNKNKGHSR